MGDIAAEAQAPATRSPWRLWLAIFAVALAPQITSTASPFLNDAIMVARAAGKDQIGLIRTIEILLSAAVMIWLSANITRFDVRRLDVIGAVTLMAGNVLALLAPDLTLLGASRAIAGIGQGCLMGLMGGLLAQTANPHRVAAGISLAVAAAAVLASLALGPLANDGGEKGVLALIALSGAVALCLLMAAPGGQPHARHQVKIVSMCCCPLKIGQSRLLG
jgi:predicted MFS family arabinose efflux permease